MTSFEEPRKQDIPQETREKSEPLCPKEMYGPEGRGAKPADKPNVLQGEKLVFSELPGFDGTIKRRANGGTDGKPADGKATDDDGNPSSKNLDTSNSIHAEKRGEKTSHHEIKDASKDSRREAGDKLNETDPKKVVENYSHTLEAAGYSKAEATRLSQGTYDRFKALEQQDKRDGTDNHLTGTPEEQMNRINKASQGILERHGAERINGVLTGRLADGQKDHLNDAARRSMVRDLANRMYDPSTNDVQGHSNDCALESFNKNMKKGGDTAALPEKVNQLVNTGSTTVTEREGNPPKSRTVRVDSRSFAPDGESSRDYQSDFGKRDIRGPFGHASDALTGQVMADLKSEREGLPTSAAGLDKAGYKFMAAHATGLNRNAENDHGGPATEALFKRDANGNYNVAEMMGPDGKMHKIDSPGAGIWDIAATNKAMGGFNGAVFAHANLLAGNEAPPPGFDKDLKITTFSNAEELTSKLKEFQGRTGQSAQLLVDAPYLPTGGMQGHGMHALNLEMNADGKTFNIDNNWSEDADLNGVSYAKIDKATNPDKWNPEGRPNKDTLIGPGGSEYDNGGIHNPDRTADSRLKKDEEERKERERLAKKAEELREEQEKLAKKLKEELRETRERDMNRELLAMYEAALGDWRSKISGNTGDQLTALPPRPEAPIHFVAAA